MIILIEYDLTMGYIMGIYSDLYHVNGGINNDSICMIIIATDSQTPALVRPEPPWLFPLHHQDAIVAWINFWIPKAREKNRLALWNHPQPPNNNYNI